MDAEAEDQGVMGTGLDAPGAEGEPAAPGTGLDAGAGHARSAANAPPEWEYWNAPAQDTYSYLTHNGYDAETARDMAWRMHLYGSVDREAPIGPRRGAREDAEVAREMPASVRDLDRDAHDDYVQLRQMGWTNEQAAQAVSPEGDVSPELAHAGGSAVNDYLVLRKKGWSDADASKAVLTGEDDIDRPNRSVAAGDDVTYYYDDGSRVVVSGGTQNLRNHNPGNMVATAGRAPTIGRSANRKFVTFPDEETGFNAEIANLQNPTYQKASVADAIKTWAPSSDNNDPVNYGHTVAAWTGIDPNTPLHALTLPQLVSFANAIQRFEGSKRGTATIFPPPAKGK